jgi:ubiquinone/menaquinone biosynthesis C-methylase UbiE
LINLLVPFLQAGDRILDIGCANGWRLRRLLKEMPALGLVAGMDLSFSALQDGLSKGSRSLVLADATSFPVRANSVDCIILGFVCYATGRRSALAVLAEVEKVIKDHGVVAVLDFLPDAPTQNPYNHVNRESIDVIKTDYAGTLVAYGGYQRVALAIRSSDAALTLRSLPGRERVGITILQRHTIPSDQLETEKTE